MGIGWVRGVAALWAWVLVAGPVAARDGLKLGVLSDLTGFFADHGDRSSILAAQIAVEDFGGSVLGKSISIVSADSQNKFDIAAGIARRWFDAAFLIEARPSGADIVALANSGSDTTNSIKQAAEFGIGRLLPRLVAMLALITAAEGRIRSPRASVRTSLTRQSPVRRQSRNRLLRQQF